MKREKIRSGCPVALAFLLYLAGGTGISAQRADTSSLRVFHKDRFRATAIGGGAAIVGSLVALDQAWYANYQRVPFHFFNDDDEWLQMDKAGHFYSTYTVGKWGKGLLDWCGVKERTALWAGGCVGLAYLAAVEYMDGRSAAWGFSIGDMASNTAGTALFIGQELAWHEQRIRMKYSSHLTDFAAQNPSELGSGLSERILKDYNGCTFWLCANPRSFGWKAMPAWLDIAGGYGAEGMLHARDNPDAYRQYYFSLDLDLERIPTKSKLLRTVFFALDCVKVPMPAIEWRSNGTCVAHALYF